MNVSGSGSGGYIPPNPRDDANRLSQSPPEERTPEGLRTPPTPPRSSASNQWQSRYPRTAIYFEDELPRMIRRVMDGSDLPEGNIQSYQIKQVESWINDVVTTVGGMDDMLRMLPASSKEWLKENLSHRPELSSIDRFIGEDAQAPDPRYILQVINKRSDKCLNVCHPLPASTAAAFTQLLKTQYPRALAREKVIASIKPGVREWLEASNVAVNMTPNGIVRRSIEAYVEKDPTAVEVYPVNADFNPSFRESSILAVNKLLPEHSRQHPTTVESATSALRMSKRFLGDALIHKYKEIMRGGVDTGLTMKEEMAVAHALVTRMSARHNQLIRERSFEPGTEHLRNLTLSPGGGVQSAGNPLSAGVQRHANESLRAQTPTRAGRAGETRTTDSQANQEQTTQRNRAGRSPFRR